MNHELRDRERLRRIEAVTDTALNRLEAPDLLEELLDRVIALLAADTAAVLMLDEHARQLVATASRGLEEEVRQGVRIAVGRGFSGRVAAIRQPVTITELSADDVVSPILREAGVTSLLGVPMVAEDELIGVLHVGSLSPRTFTADDVRLLQIVADRASTALRMRRLQADRSAAAALQRSLLPAKLPSVPGLELAARYVPGHDAGIGGDWYDVFPLPSGWLGVVIGDVSGHGLASAVVMGRVRSALRSYALISEEPADVLTLLDRKINHFEAGNLTTAVYAMVSPDRERIRVSSAGHLAPVVAEPGRPAEFAPLPVDPPLGIGRLSRPRRGITLELRPGGVFVCYTDGLVERRGEQIDDGLGRLRACVISEPADAICATAMSEVIGDEPDDDAAILALRRVA